VKEAVMSIENLTRLAQQVGLPMAMLAIILWWAKQDIVTPLLNAHFEVIGKIVEGQNKHTERLDAIGDKLDELIRVSK
jgi:hypothetical protein